MQNTEPTLRIARHHRILAWIKHHRVWSIVIALAIIICSGIGTYLLLSHPAKKASTPVVAAPKPIPPKPVVYYSLLTGQKVASAADVTAPVTAIMIENSPSARPQSGIKEAGVIYEAIAEGGITRFLTLHQQDKPQLIGPVRSVRQYYVDWLTPYQASVAHVGGSEEALTQVRDGNYRDLDEFFNGSYYWRSADRYAPHNVYTSFAKLDALNQSKGYTKSTFTSFPRVDGAPVAKPDASQVTINFSGPLYNTSYAYDGGCNCYPRSEGGEPHMDREEGQLAPGVIVALHVDEHTVLQDGYREAIQTTGTGEAEIFQNGTVVKATWRKNDPASPLELLDASGKAIPLVRGQTWIAAVPNGQGSISWQ